ncbi:MAG: hypothetical protein ACTSRA_02400 [Promethearchaeota archaeon]
MVFGAFHHSDACNFLLNVRGSGVLACFLGAGSFVGDVYLAYFGA